MKGTRYLSWPGIVAILISTAGCAEMMGPPRVIHSTPSTIPQVQRTWHGEKARVAVMEFEDKTGIGYQVRSSMKGTTVGNPIGGGMKEQLVTALMQTGAFIVEERQAIKDVIGEQDFGASGRVRRETAPAIGEIEGAEFLIYGAVTEYTPSQASLSGGVGHDPLLGALGAATGQSWLSIIAQQVLVATTSRDHIAIDIRLVDAKTSRVVHSTSIEAYPQDYGAALGGIFGSVLVGASGQYQTPTQKAVRACIIKAVNWIANNCLEQGTQIAPPEEPVVLPPGPAGPPSDLVRQIQRDLNALGYDCGKADGDLGPKTKACIDRFVQDSGISVDGSLRKESTLRKISQELRKKGPTISKDSGPTESPEPSSSGPEDKGEEWGQPLF